MTNVTTSGGVFDSDISGYFITSKTQLIVPFLNVFEIISFLRKGVSIVNTQF
jgi:hypothetical protein